MGVWWWIIGGAVGLLVTVAAIKTRRPVAALGSSALQGFCALAAVNAVGAFSGVTLGLTAFSASVCGVLGLPGVIGLLLLQCLCTAPL